MRLPSVAVIVAIVTAASIPFLSSACGQSPCGSLFCGDPDAGSGVDAPLADAPLQFPDSGTTQAFEVDPSDQSITVAIGQQTPTIQFSALDTNKSPLTVAWSTDQAAIGTVTPSNGTQTTFVPSGAVGGVVNVNATYQQQTVSRKVLVKLQGSENGGCPPSQIATSVAQLTLGGGVGGVGGEGCGVAITDAATQTALASPTNNGSAQSLAFQYPYDKTVFPRGILAPLLQWSSVLGDADAIKIDLVTTGGSFEWHGTFTRPQILSQTSGAFVRHPIPEDVWEMATNSAGMLVNGQPDRLTVSITLAKGGQGYGPISETWSIAPGNFKGSVYYGAYGTNYTTQFSCAGTMGAGTFAIKHGATSPTPITSTTQCTQCHVVGANGSALITDYDTCPGNGQDYDWSYDLKNLGAPANLPATDGLFTWGAISPQGSLYFSNSAQTTPGSLQPGDLEGATSTASGLYNLPGGTAVVTPAQIASQLGLSSQLGASLPVFSPDGKHIAFNFFKGGPGVDKKSGDGKSIAVVDFDGKSTFSNLRTVYTPPSNSSCAGCAAVWMSFTPTNDALVFELETHQSTGSLFAETVGGNRGELWWVDLATKTSRRLDGANGAGYLPTGANNHDDDTTLQYEPSIAPIASGGYVWIVFTSRRLYGSVATIDPWTAPAQSNTSPLLKKLWVAAFDLDATPGTDASHPAFYLPAQDLLTVNARAYWVLDPCEANGSSCESGDECCGGHCGTSGDGGALVCGTSGTCGGEGDTCTSSSNCCNGLQCVGGADNGHCDIIPVK
ncbi:MAG TPA: hypothetical protein VH054_17170 [Polyangiaceae bacterium]|jgi:hypothetical protein|nr:hypothetical protein [Polyangiaceae bacterium]